MEKKTMQLLPENLKEAYEYDLKICKEIPGLSYPLIDTKDVLQAHYILADYFTDTSAEENESETLLAGLRSKNLLASALGRQIVQYGNLRKYNDSIDICSTLFFWFGKGSCISRWKQKNIAINTFKSTKKLWILSDKHCGVRKTGHSSCRRLIG